MRLSIIVAAAENNVIGRNNELPWHLSEDLKYFKKTTTGKMILMGRKTYDSIGRPLPNRINVVLTRDPEWQAEGVKTVNTLDDAYFMAEACCIADVGNELFVIGGEQIYRETISSADRVYLTRVHAEVEGDAFFPELSEDEWQMVSSQPGTEEADYDYEFQVFERRA